MCDYINQLGLVCFSGGWQHFLWLSPAFCGTKVSVWTAWLRFFFCLFGVLLPDRLWAYSIFFIIHISLVVLAFSTDAQKKRWVSILRYSRRAFNFYDFWFIFTALAVPMSRVTPINVASFPSRTFGPLHWIFPRALLMLFYAAPCVFCCVFNEMFIALFFYSKPPTPIDWMKRSFRIRSTRFSRLFRFSRSSVLFIVDVVSNVPTCSCV